MAHRGLVSVRGTEALGGHCEARLNGAGNPHLAFDRLPVVVAIKLLSQGLSMNTSMHKGLSGHFWTLGGMGRGSIRDVRTG